MEFENENPNSALIRMNRELIYQIKALEIRLSAMSLGVTYMATIADEYEHDTEEDEHLRRFMAKLVKCVSPERQLEHCEMDYQVLLHALNDRTGEDEESKIANSNFKQDEI